MGGGGEGLFFFAGLRGGCDEGIGRFGAFGCPCFALSCKRHLGFVRPALGFVQRAGLYEQQASEHKAADACRDGDQFVSQSEHQVHPSLRFLLNLCNEIICNTP